MRFSVIKAYNHYWSNYKFKVICKTENPFCSIPLLLLLRVTKVCIKYQKKMHPLQSLFNGIYCSWYSSDNNHPKETCAYWRKSVVICYIVYWSRKWLQCPYLYFATALSKETTSLNISQRQGIQRPDRLHIMWSTYGLAKCLRRSLTKKVWVKECECQAKVAWERNHSCFVLVWFF